MVLNPFLMAFTPSATARWLLPTPGGPMKSTSSTSRTKAHMARVSSFDRSAASSRARPEARSDDPTGSGSGRSPPGAARPGPSRTAREGRPEGGAAPAARTPGAACSRRDTPPRRSPRAAARPSTPDTPPAVPARSAVCYSGIPSPMEAEGARPYGRAPGWIEAAERVLGPGDYSRYPRARSLSTSSC